MMIMNMTMVIIMVELTGKMSTLFLMPMSMIKVMINDGNEDFITNMMYM